MGILDTFFFVVKADTDNAAAKIEDVGEAFDDTSKKGQDASKKVGDSLDGLKARVSTIAESIKSSLTGNLAGGFAALGASLGLAAAAGIGLNSVLERAPELYQRVQDAATVGVDVTSYDAMSRAFQQNGVDADGFRDSMIDLNESMGEAASDAKSAKAQAFKTFGVSLKDASGNAKNAADVLMELSGSMANMSKQQAIFQIKQLGITDNKVIQSLLLGNKALKEQIELQKQKFALSEKDAAQLTELTQSQRMLQTTIDSIIDKFVVGLVPALTFVTDTTRKAIEWVVEHKRVIAVAAGVIAALLIPTIISATTATIAWGAATLVALAPFIAIAAAVAALILVVEDLVAYYQGADSVVGDFAAKHEMLKDVLEGLRVMAAGVIQFFSDMWNDPEKALTDFTDFMHTVWTNMVADTKEVFTELWNWIVNIFKNIGGAISDGIKGAAKDAYSSLPDWAKKGASLVGLDPGESTAPVNSVLSNAADVSSSLPSTSAQMLAQGRNTSGSTVSQKIDKVEVNVSGGDPDRVRTAVGDGLNDHLQNTAASFDDGRSH